MEEHKLNEAIDKLLEENPIRTKNPKRKRNKYKDIIKKARRNEPIVSEKIIDELLQDKLERPISHFEIKYERDDIALGIYKGWYDDIKEISAHYEVPVHELRLEKVRYWEDDNFYWDGLARVYRQAYNVVTLYYDDEDKLITTRGIWSKNCYVSVPPTEAGVYDFDENSIDFLEGLYDKNVPTNNWTRWTRERIRIGFNEEVFRKFDTENKYGIYAKAMREYNRKNFYQKTTPILKGNEISARNSLINAINFNARRNEDLLKDLDDLLENYEYSASKIIYVYNG